MICVRSWPRILLNVFIFDYDRNMWQKFIRTLHWKCIFFNLFHMFCYTDIFNLFFNNVNTRIVV